MHPLLVVDLVEEVDLHVGGVVVEPDQVPLGVVGRVGGVDAAGG